MWVGAFSGALRSANDAMTAGMTKHERVRSALRGEAPDRPPYGFWTHLPGIDLDPDRLATQLLRSARATTSIS